MMLEELTVVTNKEGLYRMAYIVIVDDDEDLNQTTADVLIGSGHEVSYYLDIESGLKSLEERIPDLLILDIMFLGDAMAGFSFVQRLNLQFNGRIKFPILMVSSRDDYYHPGTGEGDSNADCIPVTDFMQKPVDFRLLTKKIAGLLENSKSIHG